MASDAGLGASIEYSVLDLNKAELPKAAYDAIFAISSVHHVFDLENLFDQCRRALKPTGLFLLDEYIGPSRFQTPPHVVELINRLLGVLPSRYRKSLFSNDGSTIDRYVPSPIEHFLKHDPSEAVRSADILQLLKRDFDIIEFRPYGGAILHMLLSGIAGNFDEGKERDVALLRVLATFEQFLEEEALIDSDFAAIVARPKYSG
jgi:SAM-dependent methyltransferase